MSEEHKETLLLYGQILVDLIEKDFFELVLYPR